MAVRNKSFVPLGIAIGFNFHPFEIDWISIFVLKLHESIIG